jgi:hypothetical protein
LKAESGKDDMFTNTTGDRIPQERLQKLNFFKATKYCKELRECQNDFFTEKCKNHDHHHPALGFVLE